MQWVPLLLLAGAVIVILLLAYFLKSKPDEGHDADPMSVAGRRIVVWYLLIVGVVLTYLLVALNSIDFPEVGNVPEPSLVQAATAPGAPPAKPGAPAAPSADDSAPTLVQVFPQSVLGNTPTGALALYGTNFTPESKVRFNMKPRAIIWVGKDLIKAQPEPSDLERVGSISVDVVNPGNKISNALTVPVTKPRVPLILPGWHPAITREVQLLLLVICAGALGSYVHSIKSVSDFIGNRTLTASWFWWYITRPFLGSAMALVFYAVLRGGFLAGTPADAKVVNPFGVVAIGALVGMFADKAAQKLGEIFDTLFKSEDQRTGKLASPVIDKLIPDTVRAGSTQPVLLKIVGDRLGKTSTVRLNSVERKPETVSEQEVTVKLVPEDLAKPAEIKVTAVNPDGTVSVAATLHVTDLAVALPVGGLPAAVANTAYDARLSASGGVPPSRWTLGDKPTWLKIDEKTGQLSGTPTKAGLEHATVRVSDSTGASASLPLTLTISQGSTP